MTDEEKNDSNFHKIIFEICDELGIKYKTFSKNWVVMLKKDNQVRFICGYKFDTSRHALGRILDDKFATFDLLNNSGISVIEHNIIYKESNNHSYASDCKGIDYLKQLFEKYDRNIVLKINGGSCGVGVTHITCEEDLETNFEQMSENRHSLSVCPYYNILNEYRAIIVNGEIQLLYKKIKPLVVGDGKSTIKELLQKFNFSHFQNYERDDKDEVLLNGEIYEYDWKFNLSRGAISSFDVSEIERIKIEEIVNKINAIIPLSFCSVDIVKTIENEYLVMEINSGVMMNNFISQQKDGYCIAKNIYKKAILSMFE